MLAMLLMSLMGSVAYIVSGDDEEAYDPHPDGLLDQPDDVEGEVIQAGQNSTYIAGSDLSDWIAAGRSCDTVDGGEGDDTLFGERGRDMLDGEEGDDVLNGGAWHDALDGGEGNDSLIGDTGKDTLAGGEGDDTLDGGAWDDLLVGGAGADVLDGGAGDDILVGHVPDAGDGANMDISARAYHEALEQGYQERDVFFALSEADQEAFISEALAGALVLHPGEIAGADAGDTMDGGEGNDTICLSHDDDLAYGGTGDDTMIVTNWGDHVSGDDDAAPQVADYGLGSDVLVVEYLATPGATAPTITVDTLENGDQLVRVDGATLVHLVAPSTAITAEDVSLVAVEAAA